jgi:SMI1 / KNR4 family (SUKH-1)
MPFPTEMKFIRHTEDRLGVLLPLSYANAMCHENGGELVVAEEEWQLHPILDDSDRTRLKRTCNDVVRETIEARKWAGFPANGVCIAYNGGGDVLVFLPDAKDPNQLSEVIYCWHHETRELEVVASSLPTRLSNRR